MQRGTRSNGILTILNRDWTNCFKPGLDHHFMFQIVLSDGASTELSQLDKMEQLRVVAEFSRLRREPIQAGKGGIGEIRKGNRTIYRCRYKDYRIYFEKQADQLVIHHVLHGNTLRDFFVRSNLDMQNDEEFEQSARFWKFIEQRQMKIQTPAKD